MSITATDIPSLFNRARAALVFLGVERQTEDHDELNFFMAYLGDEVMLEDYQDYLDEVDKRCSKIESWKFRRDREIKLCEYVGEVGQRYQFDSMTVTFTKTEETEHGVRSMTTMTDETGNHFVYWNTINLKDENNQPIAAQKGQKVSFKAGVKEHKIFREVKQTVLGRALKAKLIS